MEEQQRESHRLTIELPGEEKIHKKQQQHSDAAARVAAKNFFVNQEKYPVSCQVCKVGKKCVAAGERSEQVDNPLLRGVPFRAGCVIRLL